MKFIRKIACYIPGFRKLSSNSMIIAATYYGASVFILASYWYWGLALLAAPFLVFFLLDLNTAKNRHLPLIVSIVAGIVVLLGTVGGLSAGSLNGNTGSITPVMPSVEVSESVQITSATSVAQPTTAQSQNSRLDSEQDSTDAPSPAPAASAVTVKAPKSTASPFTGGYAYCAAKGSGVFHLPGCSAALRIKPGNLIKFKTRQDAINAGLRPCKICKP